MTAEAIAKVVRKIETSGDDEAFAALGYTTERPDHVPVVDATALFNAPVKMSDLCVAPPFSWCRVGWVASSGDAFVVTAAASEVLPSDDLPDLPDAHWGITCYASVAHVDGPVYAWVLAVNADGSPAFVRGFPMAGGWDRAGAEQGIAPTLAALDFLNCCNIEMVEPHRSRPERRRLERLGVTVCELVVRPTRVGRAGTAIKASAGDVPLTSVRGHFSHYGDCCPGRHEPRGLAFGQLTGRYWVPLHARGDVTFGEHHSDYKLVT